MPYWKADTKAFKANQYGHTSDTFQMVPLGQRFKEVGGHGPTRPVQRLSAVKRETGTLRLKVTYVNSYGRQILKTKLYLSGDAEKNQGIPLLQW